MAQTKRRLHLLLATSSVAALIVGSGAPIPHDSAITSAGAQYFLAPNWSLMAKLSGNFGSGYQTYTGLGTLRHTW